MSAGSRSGVNCMRRKFRFTDLAIAFASVVFPVPGTSSSSRCPSAKRNTSAVAEPHRALAS